MIKLCFIDMETTGLNPHKHGVIQIAGTIDFLDKELVERKSFNFLVRPFDTDMVEDKALEVNKTTREEINKYNKPLGVYNDLVGIFNNYCDKYNKQDKMFFVGYNARFDYDFLRKWFEKCGDKYFGSFFFFPPLDVMNIAIWNCIGQRYLLPNFKLETVVNHLNVSMPEGEFHDAMKDILVTKNIFMKYLTEK